MRALHLAVRAAVVALVCGAQSQGKADVIPSPESPSIGVGMICNTSEQARQFLDLRGSGSSTTDAMNQVNKDADNPHACGIAAIAFLRDKTLHCHAVENKLLEVVRVNVLAGFDGSGWKELPVTVQYAVMEGEGDVI
jgi:hypothetical protein